MRMRAMGRGMVLAGLGLLTWAMPGPVEAQGAAHDSWTLQVDNDLFALWRTGRQRTDRDYSSGVELAVRHPLGDDRPAWMARLAGPVAWRFSLSQQIYTPDITAPRPVPDDRPYAALLVGRGSLEWRRGPWHHEMGLALGVTGEPALGEPVQRFVHALVGSPRPVGWEAQLPFQAGFTIGYAGARELLRAGPGQGLGLSLAGTWGADLGTILTRATVGGRATLGYRPGDAGLPAPAREGGLRVYGVVGGQLDAVGRVLVLDAPVDEAGTPLARRPMVARLEAGLVIETGTVSLAWTGHLADREYQGQPRAPAYGRFTVTLR